MARLVLCLFAVALFGQQQHSAEQRHELFLKNLAARGEAISRNSFQGITTLEEWKRRRPEIKKQFLDMLGLEPLPPRTPLRSRVTGGFERDGYRVENIVFESQPRLYVTGNLYLPTGEAAGAVPVIVYVSGHAPDPAGAKYQYQHHGIWFAKHGFAAFVLDTIEFGEIPGIHHGTHNLEMWHWLSLGYTPAGVEVWNAMRALDYLETRPEIDAKRAGITGRSGGGAITWFTAAADERFQVAAPVHGTWSVGPHIVHDVVKENCDCIYFWNTYQLDLPLVGALIAPRPLNIVSAAKDGMFPPAGYHPVYECLRPVYEWFGAKEKLLAFDAETGHQDLPVYRKSANEWLNRWIGNGTAPYAEVDYPKEDTEAIRVLKHYPADARNEGIHRTFVPAKRLREWKTAGEWQQRRTGLLAELKAKVYRAFPSQRTPFEAWKGKVDSWTNRYADSYRVEFNTEANLRVTGQLFIPRDGRPRHPALIYAKGREDIVYGVDFDNLLSAYAHHVVLILHPRAVDYPMENFRMAAAKMSAALLGGTLETLQLWDMLQAVNYLLEEENLPIDSISMYGRRQMAGLALHAAALDDRISRVILDDPPGSHWQGPALLNVLRVTDLAEVAALVAPREIVSLTKLPEAYRYTASLFQLVGKGGRVREAPSLAEALRVWE